MATSLACPSCKAVLKTKAEIPAGKKVKCPKCATIFAVAEEAARPASVAVRTPAAAAATRKPQPAAARPTPVRSGPPPAAAPTRRRAAVTEEEDDDRDRDDEDRPARKRRRKGRKNQGNPVLLWSLLGGGAAFLIGAFLFAGLVWPAFFLPAPRKVRVDPFAPAPVLPQANGGFPKGTGNEDLLNYVPLGCNVFAGYDLGILKQRQDLAQQWQVMADAIVMQIPGAPRGLREIIGEMDRVLLAINSNEKTGPGGTVSPEGALVIRTRNSYDPEKIRQIVQAGNPEQLTGKTYYRLNLQIPANEPSIYVHMPNDRVLVFVAALPQRLANVLSFTGVAPVVGPQAVAEIRAVENATFWAAVEITPVLQEQLVKVDTKQLEMFPDMKAAIAPLQKLKGASLAIEAGKGQKVKLSLSATCANATDSQQLSNALNTFWQKQGKGFLTLGKSMVPPDAQPVVGPLVDEVSNNLTVAANGDRVLVTLELSEQTLQNVQANAARLQMMAPRMNAPPAPPPGVRPPVVRPPVGPKGRPRPGVPKKAQ